jgi:hypothetical protein
MVLGCHIIHTHTKNYLAAEGQRESGGKWGLRRGRRH